LFIKKWCPILRSNKSKLIIIIFNQLIIVKVLYLKWITILIAFRMIIFWVIIFYTDSYTFRIFISVIRLIEYLWLVCWSHSLWGWSCIIIIYWSIFRWLIIFINFWKSLYALLLLFSWLILFNISTSWFSSKGHPRLRLCFFSLFFLKIINILIRVFLFNYFFLTIFLLFVVLWCCTPDSLSRWLALFIWSFIINLKLLQIKWIWIMIKL